MFRFLAVITFVSLLGVYALHHFLAGNDGPAFVPVQVTLVSQARPDTQEHDRAEKASEIRKRMDRRFADAPDLIGELAAQIANPAVPLVSYSDKLQALAPDMLANGWGHPYPERAPKYRDGLLRVAIEAGNTGAAAMLIEAGAPLDYNDNELPFQVVHQVDRDTNSTLWFPAYRIGTKFLRFWLEHGGDPELTHPLYGSGKDPLLMTVPVYNLEAIDVMLSYGADPWEGFTVLGPNDEALYRKPGFFLSLVSANKINSEVAFRLAKAGHYDNAPSEMAKTLADEYERLIPDVIDDDSPEGRARLWALQKALGVIFPRIDQPPGPNVTRLLDIHFSPGEGGFFLAPGQWHSPDRSEQRSDLIHLHGQETWDNAK